MGVEALQISKRNKPWPFAVLGLAVALAGCAGAGRAAMEVVRVAPRYHYLDVTLAGEESGVRQFFPATPSCRELLIPGTEVRWSRRGKFGQAEREDVRCRSVGITSLTQYRQRRARGRPIPRRQASFTISYEDNEVIMARGRFPLASTIGWVGGGDTVAIFLNTDDCRVPLERGVASMQYYPSGGEALRLVTERGTTCPFFGLAIPISGVAASK